jgi:TPP-dependent pyruvate/acetoin dehydrogenase alpha subunit
MHISDGRIRHDFSFQLVGTCIPVAAGLAWALKNHHKNGEIVAVFFGDAATSNGQFHEGLNIAAIHKVPLLFICENNQLAGNIKPEHYRANSSVTRAAKASYDLHCIDVDGNDVSAVIEAVQEGERVVRKKGPVLIECATTRLCWHKQGQRDVRSPEELALLAERDPIKNWERKHTEIDKQAVLERVNAALDTAFARALSDPLPEIEHD